MPNRAVVQSAGYAYRLNASMLMKEFGRSGGRRYGALNHLLLCYTQTLLTQMAQTAACNRHHSVDKQLCRWILLSLDRLPSNELKMTHELIANMLGVRREGVTEAAGNLQRAGLIHYRRGPSRFWTGRDWRHGFVSATTSSKWNPIACSAFPIAKPFDIVFSLPLRSLE